MNAVAKIGQKGAEARRPRFQSRRRRSVPQPAKPRSPAGGRCASS